jgi:hypothetical protein
MGRTKHKEEYNAQAELLCGQGATDKALAEVFEVSEATINNWKTQFPVFFESLKAGKEIADSKVVKSLFQRALGYSVPEVHISVHKGEVTKTAIIKHYPPDPTSMIFWLKNRDQANWRDKQELKHSGNVEIGPPIIK